ncbi:methyltransferase [Mycobacterium riyadhense]|uniref:methyltransferase n=1 Tax=Mycobacterium riyadhense TaxID=486698 RepID=UPI0023BAEBEA|nr:methyltransferase [Mycobacterium riyadhense]
MKTSWSSAAPLTTRFFSCPRRCAPSRPPLPGGGRCRHHPSSRGFCRRAPSSPSAGCDLAPGDHPDFGRIFGEAMTAFSAQELAAIHDAFDFSSVPTLVDVAGGHGAFLLSALEKNPHQRGILFDQPEVIELARGAIATSAAASRCSLVGGDFFAEVPAGDGYVLKHILHDWNDDLATTILATIHRAANPGARLFVIDAVIEHGNAPGFTKLLDLEMLVLYNGGRERTRAEIEKLFSAAGFRLLRVVPTHSPTHVIEAERL